MATELARKIISKGVLGTSSPFKTSVSVPTATKTSPSSKAPVEVTDLGDKTLMSPVPSKVAKVGNVTTYTLPDGSEFRLDDRGRPVKSERSLTTSEKNAQRGGSFQDTQEEIDHKISIALGGTDSPGNLEALKSSKTISQTVFDAITGNKRLPGNYKPQNRQEGKMIVEWKAIEKYQDGDISLFEAMAAVQHYDDQNLVASFLHEDPPKESLLQKIGEFLDPKAGGPIVKAADKAIDFIKEKVQESRRSGAINEVMGFVGGKHYFDKEDGRALIAEVGANLDQQATATANAAVRENKGVIESPFLAKSPKEQIALTVTAPIRFTAGSLARLLVDVGLEQSASDATFTPQTALQEYLMGKEDFVRLSKSGDLYGTAMNLVQENLEKKGVAHDKAHLAGMTSALLIGSVLENPFFSFGSKPAKEALEVALKDSLERELGGELPEKLLKDIAFESERIAALKEGTERSVALKEFVEKTKADPDVIKSVEEAKGKTRQIAEETTPISRASETLPSDAPLRDVQKLPDQSLPGPEPKVPKKLSQEEELLGREGSKSIPTPAQEIPSYETVITQSNKNIKNKVNFIDSFRTPDRVLEKIGLGPEVKQLRTAYEAYVKELPKHIDRITEWSKMVPTPESNTKIFNFLDGKDVVLTEVESKVAGEIKSWMSEWADRLGLPKDNRITNYITHIFDEELIAKEFDEDLAKIIANKLPGEVYDPFLQKRLGALGYKQDTWAALDAYVKRATRKVNMDPALEAIKRKAGGSLETSNLEKSQFDYIKKFIDRVNLRPTDLDTEIDNSIKALVGYKFGQRPVTRLSKLFRQWTYRGMLGLNPGSALRNLSQGVNTYAVLGEKYTTIGYAKLFNRGSMAELKEVGVLADDFIQDRVLSSTKKLLQKVDKVLFAFFEAAEKINRGAAYFGAKSKALAEGKTLAEAIDYGKEIVRKTQFSFGLIDTPVKLQGDIVKTLMQFQSYSVKQIEFLTELAKDKNFVGLLRYALGGMVFVYTVGQAFGMDLKDLLPGIRVGTPPGLKLPVEVIKATINTPDKYGQERSLSDKLSDIAGATVGLIPAGSQIKKTLGGAKSIQEGGSYDASGKLQFKQGQSLAEKVQAILFGKYVSKNAEAYFDKTAPSESETKYDEIMDLPKEERAAAFDSLKDQNPGLAGKVKAFAEDEKSGITEEEKGIRSLGVQDGARAQAVFEVLEKLESKEEKAILWEDWTKKKILTKEVMKQVKSLLSP